MHDVRRPLELMLIRLAGVLTERDLLINLYQREENRILREQLGKCPRLNDDQRRRLAVLGKQPGSQTAWRVGVDRHARHDLAVAPTGAQRAVGRANGDNRIAIVIPCHRVVRSDGTMCGYGGGLWRKKWLLDHERGA